LFFFFQAEDGIRDFHVTGVQTCALPIYLDKIGLLEYYETVENPTISVAIEMEQAGFVLDQERAKVLGKDLSEELTVIERGLREHFGEINFRSPTQLSEKF